MKLFFKTAIRQLRKYRFHSALNIAGLGISMACCLFIYTYNSYQLSFDRFHPHADRTFMVVQDLHLDKTEHSKGGAYAMYAAIKQELPQVEKAAIYIEKQDFTIKIKERLQKTEGKAAFVSSDYFEMMHFHWSQGDPSLLDQPNTVALTKTIATAYFGTEDVIGQTIYVESRFPVKVVGIIDDSRNNSDFQSALYFSLASIRELRQIPHDDGFFQNWGYTHTSNNIFLTLHRVEDKEQVEQGIRDLVAKHWHKDVLNYYSYKLLPLTSFHFDPHYGKANQHVLLVILAAIAFGILCMASVNYTNMVSAQQLYRSTEMGIRKVLGSSKKQLFVLFMMESLLISFFGWLLALVLCWLFIDWANYYLFVQEPIQILSFGRFFSLSIVLWLSISLLSSIFLIFFLNKTDRSHALKKQVAGNWSWGKKSLMIIQNVISMVLITSTIVMVRQVSFLKNTDLGFDREMVILLPLKNEMLASKDKFAQLLHTRSDVMAFTFCDNPPSNHKAWGGTIQFDKRPEWESWAPRYAIGDSSYIQTFGIQLIAGRNFRDDTDHPEFLINEKMARTLGFDSPSELIGKNLTAGGLNDTYSGLIVGVVNDFNTNSLNEAVSPTVIGFNEMRLKNLAIKYVGKNPEKLLNALEKEWKSWYPNELFEYTFYDERIADLYQEEALLEKLIWMAATMALLISALGFLGLVSIMVVKRTKEIGVRKVLGSSVWAIVFLLSKDFIKWVGLAFLITVPVAWYVMSRWLDQFAYRIDLQWWMFALTAVLGFSLTLLTIGYQAIKAALANPVESLRNE